MNNRRIRLKSIRAKLYKENCIIPTIIRNGKVLRRAQLRYAYIESRPRKNNKSKHKYDTFAHITCPSCDGFASQYRYAETEEEQAYEEKQMLKRGGIFPYADMYACRAKIGNGVCSSGYSNKRYRFS